MKPSRPQILATLLAFCAGGICLTRLFAQGNLTPSGAPAPTMKTLQQVEPRTPIGSLPFTITNGGSYYLTASLTAASGQNGITVQADNVTVDLAGFSLLGSGNGTGVLATASVKNFSLANGVLRGWTHGGVLSGAVNSQVEHLRLSDNAGDGITIGSTTVIRDCVAANNTGGGVRVVGNNSRVENNHSTGNQGNGFRVSGTGNLIVKNSAAANTGGDYAIAAGSSYGQILNPGPNFTNDVPWANFGTGTGATCGNGTLELSETCDDGNLINGDGCSATCTVQAGFYCTNSPSVCVTVCGDGITAGTEQCDDGNTNNNDGCSSTCQLQGCATAADCPGSDTACQTRTCTGGVCGFNYVASGTLAGSQTAGDCQKNVCDGFGSIQSVADNTDVPNDNNQCTSDQCVAGVPSNSPSPLNTSCNQGGGVVCNGIGNCVQCNSPSQCAGSDTICQTRTCTANTCGMNYSAANTVCAAASCSGSTLTQASMCNGVGGCVTGNQVSCGNYTCNPGGTACNTTCSSDANCTSGAYCSSGTCVTKKTQGAVCIGSNECGSGFCVDGVCCNTSCNSLCMACSAAKKGSGTNGTCGNIAAGTDPDAECSGGTPNCNGAGACQ